MEDQINETIGLVGAMPRQFRDQLDRMRNFRDKMQTAGAAPQQEQFAVRKITPIEPRRSIAIHR